MRCIRVFRGAVEHKDDIYDNFSSESKAKFGEPKVHEAAKDDVMVGKLRTQFLARLSSPSADRFFSMT